MGGDLVGKEGGGIWEMGNGAGKISREGIVGVGVVGSVNSKKCLSTKARAMALCLG